MLVNLDYVLKDAQKNKYGVGLFNTTDSDMLQAVIEAAEELNSPVIIGTAEVLLPYGELKLIAPSLIAAAKRATVPVVVHYDHGLTFDRCIEALKLGFSSIMFDGSAGDEAENHEIAKFSLSIGRPTAVQPERRIMNHPKRPKVDVKPKSLVCKQMLSNIPKRICTTPNASANEKNWFWKSRKGD